MVAESQCPIRLRSAAFTLVELLVVVAVIAILASLLLTVLPQAKSAAYRARCQSNLRQLGLALRFYVDDQGFFPTDDTFQHSAWKYSLSHYLGPNYAPNGPDSLLSCPKAGTPAVARTYGYNGLGFGPNLGLFGSPKEDGTGFTPVRESEVLAPAEMIAIGDGFIKTAGGQVLAPSDLLLRIEQSVSASPEALQFWARAASVRHNDQANIAFCDGHVELIQNKKLFLDDSDDALRRWNKDNRPHSQ